MMASDSYRFYPWLIVVLLSLQASLAISSASSQTEGEVTWFKRLPRNKRQLCADGNYTNAGITCCLCAAGQRLKNHCIKTSDDRVCEHCEPGTFSSHPNYQQSCEPCTSCDQANANLEVEEPCTIASNTKCKCKEGHYCNSDTKTCKICHPCKECGDEGVKDICTATSNTVCNDKTQGANTGLIVGIIVPLVLVAVIAVIFWRWKKRRTHQSHVQRDKDGHKWEMEPLKDIQPQLPDIAEVLGWKVMKNIAMKSSISRAIIDACVLNHPNDNQEQTLQLLEKWVEKEGKGASGKLVQSLQNSGNNLKAEKVVDILRLNPPV